MKKIIFKAAGFLMLAVFFALGLSSCKNNSDDESGSENNDVFEITDASSLKEAMKLDTTKFFVDSNARSANRAAAASDVTVDVDLWMRTLSASDSGLLIINTIAYSESELEFGKEVSVHVNELPEFINDLLRTTGMTPAFYKLVFKNAKVKANQIADDEYEMRFRSSFMGEKFDSYINVKGKTSDNLTIWWGDSGTYSCFEKHVNSSESSITLRRYEDWQADEFSSYTKMGNKDGKNFLKQIDTCGYIKGDGTLNFIPQYYSLYENGVGIFHDESDYPEEAYDLIYGLSNSNPSLLMVKKYGYDDDIKMIEKDFYQSARYDSRNKTDFDYTENFYSILHADDDEMSIDYNSYINPLYYSTNTNFCGLNYNAETLNPEVKAICDGLYKTFKEEYAFINKAKKISDVGTYWCDVSEIDRKRKKVVPDSIFHTY